jgi:excisionase family DNA binding protein
MKASGRDVIVLSVTAEVAGHVTIALQQHRKWARTAGLAVPDELDQLERALANRARRGQTGTPVEDLWQVRHAEQVSPKLLSYAATAQVLGLSERSVKRIIATGVLTPVRIGGSSRIRVEQVDDYLERLTAQSLTPSPKDVPAC